MRCRLENESEEWLAGRDQTPNMYRKRKPVFAIGFKGVFAPLASDSFVGTPKT